jgi:hypothetical protein
MERHSPGGEIEVTGEPSQREAEPSVELKDPMIAALLAWLIPGLGHFYQGRFAKAILFFVCILGTFSYGVYLGGSKELGWGRAVYASWRPGNRRLPYLCQIGIGLPAMPALVQAIRVRKGDRPLSSFMAPPQPDNTELASQRVRDALRDQPTLNDLQERLPRLFEFATVYTMVAGLLNVLAIYDAWGGPVFSEKGEEDEDDDAKADAARRNA